MYRPVSVQLEGNGTHIRLDREMRLEAISGRVRPLFLV